MVASSRLNLLLVCTWMFGFFAFSSVVQGIPFGALAPSPASSYQLLAARAAVTVITASNGTRTVYNTDTSEIVSQVSASDGGGADFSAPAIIWLAFSFAVGVPLALGGVGLWRFTTGAGIGIAGAVCVWAAFVNAFTGGVSDLVLTVLVMGAFAVGFFIGLLDFGRAVAVGVLSILGGIAFGIRIVLLRPGLLVPVFAVNWVIVAVFAAIGGALLLKSQRLSITVSTASIGTFLTGLGIDLIVSRQSGMSFGLRTLFDQNSSHIDSLTEPGYNPPVATYVIIGVSLGLTPVLAFAQHKIFRQPFHRRNPKQALYDDDSEVDTVVGDTHEAKASSALLKHEEAQSPLPSA